MLELSKYVNGKMTVLQLNGQSIQTGKAPIFIYKISMQEMIIISGINFPEGTDVLLLFSILVNNNSVKIKAKIDKWLPNSKQDQYSYLVKFETNTIQEEDTVFHFVNTIQMANKKKNLSKIVETTLSLEFGQK